MEKLSNKKIIGVAVLSSLGFLAACAKDATQVAADSKVSTSKEYIPIDHTYTADGRRLTEYNYGRSGSDFYADRTLAYCDGLDLVELPDSVAKGLSVVERSTGHPACADGKLTPEDFSIPAPLG